MHNKQVEFDTGGQLEAEAQRIAGLATRLERMLAISAMVEAKPGGWAWDMGRCVMLWAERIASLPGRDARREALQEVPPASPTRAAGSAPAVRRARPGGAVSSLAHTPARRARLPAYARELPALDLPKWVGLLFVLDDFRLARHFPM